MKNKTIYQVDSFTSEPFKGNPAGVMIIDNEMSDEQMQNIAAEMNLSETAFVIPLGGKFKIRYFTPTIEVPLCGHATLASAHILYETGVVTPSSTIVFVSKAGELIISKCNEYITMDFPEYALTKLNNTLANFEELVGFEPVELYSSSQNWVVAVASNEDEILNAQPNFEKIAKQDFKLLLITAKGDKYSADFVLRCFGPAAGINEDPVTGSVHCALTPLWADKLGKTEMKSMQLSKRTGRLEVKLQNNRVEISGQAITIFKAKLFV